MLRFTHPETLHKYPATLRNMAEEPWRGKAVRVFVTFEQLEAKHKAVRALAVGTLLSQVFPDRVKLPDHLKLNGRVLTIANPPAPDLILWQNLEYGWESRLQEGVVAIFVTVILVALCFLVAASFTLDSEKEELLDENDAHTGNTGKGLLDVHSKKAKGYLRAIEFGLWIQIFNVIVTRGEL